MSKIFNKYTISKADGSEIDPKAEYFILRIDTDPSARSALLSYASCMKHTGDTELAEDIEKWLENYRNFTSCEWKFEDRDYGSWKSSCAKGVFFLEDGDPKDNLMEFCPLCGLPLKVVK